MLLLLFIFYTGCVIGILVCTYLKLSSYDQVFKDTVERTREFFWAAEVSTLFLMVCALLIERA